MYLVCLNENITLLSVTILKILIICYAILFLRHLVHVLTLSVYLVYKAEVHLGPWLCFSCCLITQTHIFFSNICLTFCCTTFYDKMFTMSSPFMLISINWLNKGTIAIFSAFKIKDSFENLFCTFGCNLIALSVTPYTRTEDLIHLKC